MSNFRSLSQTAERKQAMAIWQCATLRNDDRRTCAKCLLRNVCQNGCGVKHSAIVGRLCGLRIE